MTGGVPRPGKPIICLDFDGVIHAYSRGWQEGEIYDDVTEGFFNWVLEAHFYFDFHIYSSRSKTEAGREAMKAWLEAQFRKEHKGWADQDVRLFLDLFTFAHEKPPAFLTIDDRAIQFDGDWGSLDPGELKRFKPWTAR